MAQYSGSEAKGDSGSLVKTIAITAAITVVITVALTVLSLFTGGFASNVRSEQQTWTVPIVIHLATVVPALVIGGALLLMPKGTRGHRLAGRVYVVLMLVTATATIFIGEPGTGIAGTGFSFIHLFTVMAFTSMPYAVWAARTGRIKAHREAMQGTYVGLCLAGGFSLLPGRLLSNAVFG